MFYKSNFPALFSRLFEKSAGNFDFLDIRAETCCSNIVFTLVIFWVCNLRTARLRRTLDKNVNTRVAFLSQMQIQTIEYCLFVVIRIKKKELILIQSFLQIP